MKISISIKAKQYFPEVSQSVYEVFNSRISQKILLNKNKKYILRTKENVPYRTVPVETFRSGYWP